MGAGVAENGMQKINTKTAVTMKKLFFIFTLALIIFPAFAMRKQIDLNWNVGYKTAKEANPKKFIPATVPDRKSVV